MDEVPVAKPSDVNFREQAKQMIEPLALPHQIDFAFDVQFLLCSIFLFFFGSAPQRGSVASPEGGLFPARLPRLA